MSEQTIETSIETEFQPNSDGNLEPQTMEDKFFGVKTEIKPNEDNIDVEIVDDVPEEDKRPPKQEVQEEETIDDETLDKEIADYSKRAGDRINKIKYEYHEERRAKEQAQREQQEAVTRLQTLMTENQKMQAMINQGGEVLNQTAINNAKFAKINAQEKFKKAYDEGNAEEMALAQEELAKAALAEQGASQYSQKLQEQVVAEYEKQAPVQQQLDPAMDAWSKKNTWFMGSTPADKQMTAYAMFIDQKLQAEGVDPATQSDKYYSSVDTAMRKEFPNFFGISETKVEEEPIEEKQQPTNVVAPASRSTGEKSNPRKIVLTQSQVNLARQLRITPEQYAKQLLKES